MPAWGEARIRGAVESRPDWCISRQRAWGVPIPAFFDAQKKAYLDAGVVRGIADKVEEHGTNLWFDATPAQLLAGVKLPGRLAGAGRAHLRPRHPRRLVRFRLHARRHAPARPGRHATGPPISTSKAATSTAAGSSPRSGPA